MEVWKSRKGRKKDYKTNFTRESIVSNVFNENSNANVSPIAIKSNSNCTACCDSKGRISLVSVCKEKVVKTYDVFENEKGATAFALGESHASIGGRDRETVVFDIETGKSIWKAKNLPVDPRTLLQHPVWSTALQFINAPQMNAQSESTSPFQSDSLLVS